MLEQPSGGVVLKVCFLEPHPRASKKVSGSSTAAGRSCPDGGSIEGNFLLFGHAYIPRRCRERKLNRWKQKERPPDRAELLEKLEKTRPSQNLFGRPFLSHCIS